MMLDIPPDKVQEDPKGSNAHLENYLKIISESPMFPAFSANIQELLGILEDPYYPVFEVSRVVLRDVSLTTQILKLVNSIYFQSRQRQVHTISSAVMIMGFELVRDLAVGLKLFENFQKSASLDKVKQLMFLSFFMALATQELAHQDHRFEGEELFLTALLYNFGELAAAYYFPEEYRQVLDVVEEGQLGKSAAVHQVFRCSLDDLGQSLLMTWNFPDTLRVRLADLKKPGWELPGPAEQRRRLFKGIEELSQALLNPEVPPEKRQKLQERMARNLGLQPEVMVRTMTVCLHRLQELTRILNLDVENLGLSLPKVKAEEDQAPEKVEPEKAATVQPGQPAVPDSPGPAGASDQELSRLNFLLQVIEEINQAIATRTSIHQVFMMILEGIYQGIGFDRVVFCMVDRQRTWITGRFGMGEGVEALLPLLKAPFASKTNPLSLSVAHAREYTVGPEARPENPPFLEKEFWGASGAQAVLVSPILIDAAPIGVIYLDRLQSLPAITALDRQRLQSFRDLAVIALRLSSQRGQGGLTG
jgi:eukaryotic-like serine/threonine-protein kinase